MLCTHFNVSVYMMFPHKREEEAYLLNKSVKENNTNSRKPTTQTIAVPLIIIVLRTVRTERELQQERALKTKMSQNKTLKKRISLKGLWYLNKGFSTQVANITEPAPTVI